MTHASILACLGMRCVGAGGGGRTHTQLPVRDFESRASASSATPAGVTQNISFGRVALRHPLVRYRRVPFHEPEQLPPENVPLIDRRSDDSVALNV